MTVSLTLLFFFIFLLFFYFIFFPFFLGGGGGGGGIGYSNHYLGSVEISAISIGQSDSPIKNSGSTVIFTIYFFFYIFGFKVIAVHGFKSCSMATVILRQVLSIVICESFVVL